MARGGGGAGEQAPRAPARMAEDEGRGRGLLREYRERRREELRREADAAGGPFLRQDRGGRPDVSEGVAQALQRTPGLGGLQDWARGLEERLLGEATWGGGNGDSHGAAPMPVQRPGPG